MNILYFFQDKKTHYKDNDFWNDIALPNVTGFNNVSKAKKTEHKVERPTVTRFYDAGNIYVVKKYHIAFSCYKKQKLPIMNPNTKITTSVLRIVLVHCNVGRSYLTELNNI